MSDATLPRNEDSLRGMGFALSAYLLWGVLPIYMKALAHVPPHEVVAHRVIWSVPVALGVLVALGRTSELRVALQSPRLLLMASVTAALISVNWGIYVWAIGAGQTLDTALGYYINPLFSVFLGAVLLGERLGRLQLAAIALAVAAVVVLTVEAGRLPFVAISLTFTWGGYAYLKKSLPLGPNQGFLLEVLILLLPALAIAIWLEVQGAGHFLGGSLSDRALLLGTGIITATPLMLYANGAKLLRLSTIGFLQYVSPTLIFLTAVFVFNEPFGRAEAIAFPMIWAALAIYTVGLIRGARGQVRPPPAPRGRTAPETSSHPRS
ncbi:EamA family transporter RarD [Cereibacter sphaeroides]|uniref:EamA family transporter RarD n=1 Tax=Cereibacter sphaeroides TaxID=1063 RepID=UPI001F39B584|nr:EamA family transporter RarD [Cereibacter sphaeroides]MCE6960751.1 EamA family transporter RarD [Cereibacter sphaeroides]MCE6969983.1 EamA family transporter RarD [Cereibacter sphaeroides]MCE6974371.1 EamA family transporter RarD [Cereibacter sphaeroides]